MTCADLITFICESKTLPKILSPEQIKYLKAWAKKVPPKNQLGYLIPIQKIPDDQLETYLENLIPDFPQ